MLTVEDLKDTRARPYAVYGGKVHSFKIQGSQIDRVFDGEILQKNHAGNIFAVFINEAEADIFQEYFAGCDRVSYSKYCNAFCLSDDKDDAPTQDREKVQDAMQSALAMTQHLQTRILQCALRGEVSKNIAEEIKKMCDQITESFKNNS